jgi:hypothetical protein
VEKWFTEVSEGESYTTRTEQDGFDFTTTMRIEGKDWVTLTSSHDSQPQGLGSRLNAIPMALFFRGVIRKHILADLEDYKAAERG